MREVAGVVMIRRIALQHQKSRLGGYGKRTGYGNFMVAEPVQLIKVGGSRGGW